MKLAGTGADFAARRRAKSQASCFVRQLAAGECSSLQALGQILVKKEDIYLYIDSSGAV